MSVEIGAAAPLFELPDQSGNLVRGQDFQGKSALILFFYPQDYTPVCTLENKAFRDAYQEFRAHGAEVLGVSSDGADRHTEFCESLNLPFRLLTDRDNRVRDEFGAKGLFGRVASRATYVIDKNGIVCHIYVNAFRAHEHVKAALAALQQEEAKAPT